MIALLGLMAVAGYQNRDKISGMLQGAGGQSGGGQSAGGMGSGGGMIDDLKRMFTGGGTGMAGGLAGGSLAGGLNELIGRFSNPVHQAKARTWVDTGPNGSIEAQDLESVLDEDTLADLSQQTGLSREELLTRLSQAMPDAVDRFTPHGRIPTDEEARGLL